MSDEGEGPKRLLLVTTVELKPGQNESIEIHTGDKAADVALDFCKEHDLPDEVIAPLALHIEDNLSRARRPSFAAEDSTAELTPTSQSQSVSQPLSPIVPKIDLSWGANAVSYHISKTARSRVAAADSRPLSARTMHSVKSDGMVYERLYEQALSQREKHIARRQQWNEAVDNEHYPPISAGSKLMMRDRNRGEYDNYGARLYAEALHDSDRKRKLAAKRHEEQEALELKEATHKPHINRMAKDVHRDPVWTTPWQRLNKSMTQQTKARILNLKRETEEAEARECTFSPRINSTSSRLDLPRGRPRANGQAYKALYEDASRRQRRQAELEMRLPEEYTFAPQLVATSLDSALLSLGPHVAVSERLYALQEKSAKKAEMMKWLQEQAVDHETGQALFRPQTGRGPKRKEEREATEIHLRLYELQKQRDKRAIERIEREAQCRTLQAVPHSTGQSASMYAAFRDSRLDNIFTILSEDQEEGFLELFRLAEDAEASKLSSLPHDAQTDIKCAAKILHRQLSDRLGGSEVDFLGITDRTMSGMVDRAQFLRLMQQALLVNRGMPRSYLVPTGTKKTVEQPTFKPDIQQKSKALAARLRPKGTPAYQILHHTASEVHSRNLHRQQLKDDLTLKACTFQPDMRKTLGRTNAGNKRSGKQPKSILKGSATMPSQNFSNTDMASPTATTPSYPDHDYEDGDMDQDVREAFKAGDQLGLMETRDADRTMGAYSDDFYETLQPPRTRPTTSFKIQRWTSDADEIVAELHPSDSFREQAVAWEST